MDAELDFNAIVQGEEKAKKEEIAAKEKKMTQT